MASNPAPDKVGKERELSDNLLSSILFLTTAEQSVALARSSLQIRFMVLPHWQCVTTAAPADQDLGQTHP